MIIVNGWKPLTVIAKRQILDIAAVLDPPLISSLLSSLVAWCKNFSKKCDCKWKRENQIISVPKKFS